MTPTMPWVLMAEDNQDDSELMAHAWSRTSVEARLETARDGEAAIDVLRRCVEEHTELPALLVLDLRMPRMDGLELLRRLRADPDVRSIPAVVCSSSQEPADIDSCYSAGANGYVVKPREASRYRQLVAAIDSFWLQTNCVSAAT